MSVATELTVHNKDNPFLASMTENRSLTKEGSAKETRHCVIDIAGSGLTYEPGDSLGVYPSNATESVEELLAALKADGEERVTLPKQEQSLSLRDALTHRLALAGPTRKTLQFFYEKTTRSAEKSLLGSLLEPGSRAQMMDYLFQREFIDLLEEYPGAREQFTLQEFVSQMRRLNPRLYSIASSPRMFPDEVHLTVAVVRYTSNGRSRIGVCSTYLAERVPLYRHTVPVFVASSHFGLPDDPTRDIIMVGPGTGVAPFRAFLQHRKSEPDRGRSWLFFGDQHRATDYLYEEEWEEFLARGELTRLDLAFSRDQKEKVYVQHRMQEHGAALWDWIRGGAAFLVCGDAKRMAKDVDVALHEIIAGHGGMSAEEASDYVKTMRRERRYQRDVY